MDKKNVIKESIIIFPLLVLFYILLVSVLAPILEYARLEISRNFYELLRPICHQMPTRSLFIYTSPMALCSRCFFLYLMMFITGIVFYFKKIKHIYWKTALLLIMPCIIDGGAQYLGLKLSTNLLRSITGALAGVGLGIFFFPCYSIFLDFLLKRRRAMIRAAIFLLILIPSIILPQKIFAGDTVVLLKDGTPVILKLTEEVSTKNKNLNDMAHLEVAKDVLVDGKVAIKTGTAVEATVNVCVKPDIIGQEGTIGFVVNSSKAVDGQVVYLRANLTRSGENKEILSAGAAYVCCPIFGLIKGSGASYPEGTEIKAYTENDLKIKVN